MVTSSSETLDGEGPEKVTAPRVSRSTVGFGCAGTARPRRGSAAGGWLRLAGELVVFVAIKIAVPFEGLLQLRPRPVQPHLGIASTDPKGLGDFIVREAAELAEHEDGPLAVRKSRDHSADAIT